MWEYLLLAVAGLLIGSFLGAYTYRYPRGISVFWGRSACPKCGRQIAWYDNIPLFSYLLLGGRCRRCGQAISNRYPLIELATAIGFVLLGAYVNCCATTLQGTSFQGWLGIAYFALVFSVLLAVFVIDFEHRLIPDDLVFFLLLIGYLFLLFTPSPITFYLNLASGFGAALFLLSIHLATRGRGMGLGDVKFALFGGTLLSWPKTLIWLFLAFLIGATLGVILILLGKASLKGKIAFGPFLVISLGLAFIWGERVFSWFVNLQ